MEYISVLEGMDQQSRETQPLQAHSILRLSDPNKHELADSHNFVHHFSVILRSLKALPMLAVLTLSS